MATLLPPASDKALHIAMVDDDPQLLGVWLRVLRAGGFEVEGFDDPQRLLEVLGTRPFDAIVTDLEMPVMDGVTFIRKLRARPHGAALPIVMASRVTDPRARERAMAAGATEYLVKLDRDEFVAVVERHLGETRRAA